MPPVRVRGVIDVLASPPLNMAGAARGLATLLGLVAGASERAQLGIATWTRADGPFSDGRTWRQPAAADLDRLLDGVARGEYLRLAVSYLDLSRFPPFDEDPGRPDVVELSAFLEPVLFLGSVHVQLTAEERLPLPVWQAAGREAAVEFGAESAVVSLSDEDGMTSLPEERNVGLSLARCTPRVWEEKIRGIGLGTTISNSLYRRCGPAAADVGFVPVDAGGRRWWNLDLAGSWESYDVATQEVARAAVAPILPSWDDDVCAVAREPRQHLFGNRQQFTVTPVRQPKRGHLVEHVIFDRPVSPEERVLFERVMSHFEKSIAAGYLGTPVTIGPRHWFDDQILHVPVEPLGMRRKAEGALGWVIGAWNEVSPGARVREVLPHFDT